MPMPTDLTPFFTFWLGYARSMHLWFHGAHNLTTGPAFAGDHALYAEMYADYEAMFDTLAEKAMRHGLDALVQPAAVKIKVVPVPPGGDAVAQTAMQMEARCMELLAQHLAQIGPDVPLGLDNYLRGVADAHDTFLYKLMQRTKGSDQL